MGSSGQNQKDEGLRVKKQPREGSRDHGYLGSQAGDLGQRRASPPFPSPGSSPCQRIKKGAILSIWVLLSLMNLPL